MKREHDLQQRVESLETLGEAVSAMKSLSAHHFRSAREALGPARTYREGLDRIIRSTGASIPAGTGARGLVVVGAQLGFCGAYNSRVAAAAAEYRDEHGPGPTFCVGRRAGSYVRRQDIEVERAYDAPASSEGISEILIALAQAIIEVYIDQNLSAFDVVVNRFDGVGAFHPEVVELLPMQLDPEPDAPKSRYVSPDHLSAVAMRELMYITMVELLLDALASEHGARLVATQAAEKWLDERIARLHRHLSASRREASTQEVIEISTGRRTFDTQRNRQMAD